VRDAATDAELVQAACQGDELAFEALVRRHADAVYGHALRFFGERAAAEDAMQEVFLKLVNSLGSFKGDARFSTWLFRVTRNACLDLARRQKRVPIPLDPVDMPTLRTEDIADLAVTTTDVEKAMRTLPPEERDALSAIGLFGMDYRTASETLKTPVGTVKSRVFRARRALALSLGFLEEGDC